MSECRTLNGCWNCRHKVDLYDAWFGTPYAPFPDSEAAWRCSYDDPPPEEPCCFDGPTGFMDGTKPDWSKHPPEVREKWRRYADWGDRAKEAKRHGTCEDWEEDHQ